MTRSVEQNKVVLVTGGAGYIGSHACKALARAGYLPVSYDNFSSGHEWAVKWGPSIRGDILDPKQVLNVLKTYAPSSVIHFAGSAYVGESVTDPGKYYRNNVTGTLTLLEAMRSEGINKIVFSSTCATYGIPELLPITELAIQRPINPYGATKLMVERMLQDFAFAHGIRAVALRYFNAAGADPDLEIGECHIPETHLIPLMLDSASGRKPHITIFGSDYATPDGTCVRDYIHVSDLAVAHVKALAFENGEPWSAFNLGNGQAYSILDVLKTVEKVTGCAVPVAWGERRKGDADILISDAGKAKAQLGWSVQFTKIEEIISTSWGWHQKLVNRPNIE
jgi:UDP-arabinose 4-epimerase